jgi:hypothetical protein
MKEIANNYEQVTEKTPENRERITTSRSQKISPGKILRIITRWLQKKTHLIIDSE